MEKDQKKACNDIKTIIKVCNDGAEGYQKAAKKTVNSNLQTLFNRIAQYRRGYAAELDREARAIYGEEVGDIDSTKGDIHQIWIDVKATFSGNTDEALLEECIRGEKAALETYEKVIEKDRLPLKLMDMVTLQFHEISASYRKMDILETASNG